MVEIKNLGVKHQIPRIDLWVVEVLNKKTERSPGQFVKNLVVQDEAGTQARLALWNEDADIETKEGDKLTLTNGFVLSEFEGMFNLTKGKYKGSITKK